MKIKKLFPLLALAATLTAGASLALRQDEAWPTSKPGPEHEVLKKMAGTWNAKATMMGMEFPGTQTNKMALGDLWLMQDYSGEMGGQPYAGHGFIGFDPEKKQYGAVWIDSMSTALEPMTGKYDAEKKELRFEQDTTNPMTGEPMTGKLVYRLAEADKFSFHMFMPGPDGQDMDAFTITYERKK